MGERAKVVGAALLGAAVGAALGYLYLTEQGREVRADLEPRLDGALEEVRRLRGTVGKFKSLVDEGRRSIDELASRGDRVPDWVTSYRSGVGS